MSEAQTPSGGDRGENGRSIENLVDYVRTLPVADQLEVLQRLAPAILAELEDDEREEFIDLLNVEISRAVPAIRPASR